jgi:hypothetical protein
MRRALRLSSAIAAILLCCALAAASAETSQSEGGPPAPPAIQAVYIETPPVIDGQLDDECWTQAARLEGFFVPGLEQPVPEETVALICVGEEAIYMAAICRDRTPEDIVATETRRNGEIYNDDVVEIDLDPWHGHKDAYYFAVTPRGTQRETIPGGSATKIEWRGDWTAAARRTSDGWQAEMAIPFGVLQYPPGQDTFGFSVFRRFSEERLWVCYPDMGKTYDSALAADLVGLRPPTVKPRPMLMPYVTADMGDVVGRRFDAGLDMQYRMPNGLTLLGALNPDFKQIEDVVEPISFSYTERYLRDPRPFFVTGQDEFFPREHLLYTRRVEDFDAGLKVFGSLGNETIGLLDAITYGSENALAGSWRHRFDEYMYSKLLFVSHRKAGEPDNLSYGLDVFRSWRKPDGEDMLYLVFYESQTHGARREGSYAIGGMGHRVRGSAQSNYDWLLLHVTENFSPPLGYYPDNNYVGAEFNFGGWHRFEEGPLLSRGWHVTSDYKPYLRGDGVFLATFSPSYDWSWRDGRSTHLGFTLGRREGYRNSDVHSHYGWNDRDMYRRGSVFALMGKRQGGDYSYYSLDQGLRPIERLSLRLSAAYSHLTAPAESAGHEYQTVLTASYDITPEKCIAARGIWREAGLTAYASYRQVVRRGMDIYVIVGDPDPGRTGFAERVALKLIWTF